MAKFYRYIDDPPQIFFWDVDDVVLFSVFMGIGIVFNILFFMVLLGGGIVYGLGKVKEKKAEGFLLHAAYWYGIKPMKNTPPSYIKEFIE